MARKKRISIKKNLFVCLLDRMNAVRHCIGGDCAAAAATVC